MKYRIRYYSGQFHIEQSNDGGQHWGRLATYNDFDMCLADFQYAIGGNEFTVLEVERP